MITPVPRGLVCESYSNHSGSCKDIWDNIYAVFTCSPPDEYPKLIIRRRQHGTGVWATIAEFPATREQKYGYATLECVGAHLVVITPERQPDGTTPEREYLLVNAVAEFA